MEPGFNNLDFQSATWKKLDQYLNERLATLREQNDKDMSGKRTNKLRGRIAEINLLLALGKAALVPTESDGPDVV